MPTCIKRAAVVLVLVSWIAAACGSAESGGDSTSTNTTPRGGISAMTTESPCGDSTSSNSSPRCSVSSMLLRAKVTITSGDDTLAPSTMKVECRDPVTDEVVPCTLMLRSADSGSSNPSP